MLESRCVSQISFVYDCLKVRLQCQTKERQLYRGTLDCFRAIIKKESVSQQYQVILILCMLSEIIIHEIKVIKNSYKTDKC